MFKNNVIRKRVLKAIDKKIDEAQVELDNESKNLDAQCFVEIVKLREKLETDKEALIETHVSKILGKII